MLATDILARTVQTHGDRIGTIFGDRKRSWGEIGERVKRAAAMLCRAGVTRGSNVAVLAFNSDRYLELFFAIPWAGGVILPMNVRWAVPEIVDALRESRPVVLFVDDAFAGVADDIRSAVPSIAAVISIGETVQGDHPDYEALIASEEHQAAPSDCDEVYTIFYTGGTTGRPRGVMMTHANVVAASLSWLTALALPEDVVQMHVGGFFHLSGAGHMWYVTMAGGTHVIMPKFEVVSAMEAIHRHRVTHTLLLPTMVNMMLNHTDIGKYDLGSMRKCIYGGSPMPEALLLAFMSKLPSWAFVQAYAMTESSGLATFLQWERHMLGGGPGPKIRSAGQAGPGVNLRIVDPTGKEQPRGEVGEIAMRGLHVMRGYFNNSQATQNALRDGWLRTGDLAWMDRDGFVYVVDRAKDMIISGGENVYSAEVENAIYRMPGVKECAVIGIPSAEWGESVHAVVVPKDGSTIHPDEVIAQCRALIANYKCPKSVEIRGEPLPQTPAGKIRKEELRSSYWAGRSRNVN